MAIKWSKEFTDQGWYSFRCDAAKSVPEFVRVIPDGTPVLVGHRRMPAPWPDLRIALPITDQALQGLIEADPATLESVEIELEDAAVRATQLARAGKEPGRQN